MKALKNYIKRTFLITGNVRDEFILNNASKVQLDRYLYIYLKKKLNYDSIVFLDAKGIYYFEAASHNVLHKKNKHLNKKATSKLKRHNKKILINTNKPEGINNSAAEANTRLRVTYQGDIVEITQFILSHLRENDVKFAFVVYDGSLFEKLPPSSDIAVQMQGMLRNEIDNLPSSNYNIFIWVDGEDYETLSRKFSRIGFDFLFSFDRDKDKPGGRSEIIEVPAAGKDEVQRSVSLRALKSGKFPLFEEVNKYAPVIAGIMKQRQENLKTFNQYLNEKKDFWSHTKEIYGLKTEKKTALEQLNEMIGLESLKSEIIDIVKGIEKKEIEFEEDLDLIPERFKIIKKKSLPYIQHLALLGNPGTGKTTIARLIGKILREEGILESGHLLEITKENLTAGYLGQTAIKTKKQVQKALGGILFLDEAYELITDEHDSFGKDALGELIKAMSDYQGQFMMIFAGYKNETEKMLRYNPGSARRIQHIELLDYSTEELQQIMTLHLKNSPLKPDQEIIDNSYKFCENLLGNRHLFGGNHFGNAGVIVTQIEKACQKARTQNSATLKIEHFEYSNFFKKIIKKSQDLDDLIGLEDIKKQLKILFKRSKREKTAPGHYIFQGNPGTGKTVVATQMANKFYEIGILKSAKLNHYSASELISEHVGGTESKLNKILGDSLGGVLFIDEAHQLAPSGSGYSSYGANVLNTIVPFMEANRKKFSLILAGYTQKMQNLFNYDQGLKGRFRKIFDFKDYSSSELVKIFHKMLENEPHYLLKEIEDGKHNIDDILENTFNEIKTIEGKNFSNARMVRSFISNLKDKAIEHAESGESVFITESDILKVREEWK